MSFEQQQEMLNHLGQQMIDEADSDNWDQVARLHQQLQQGLVSLFRSPGLPEDGRATTLLEHIQAVNETISARASVERDKAAKDIKAHRRHATARQSYTECFLA
ncbi:MAG: flagellar protein FliT [Xanthomonadales bacterium]|nr:flagellar protein FliT [Xanthomonadales bacterium]